MKQHRQSTAALALMTFAVLIVTAWASSAVADDPAKLLRDLPEQGLLFDVFLHEDRRPGHEGMKIAVVQTQTAPEVTYGLVFLQTGRGVRGQGIICESDNLEKDGYLECGQNLGGYDEILKIGAIGSKFCNDLWQILDKDTERRTSNGNNPVAKTTTGCGRKYCICYDIEHVPPQHPKISIAGPPNSGSGTGGHN